MKPYRTMQHPHVGALAWRLFGEIGLPATLPRRPWWRRIIDRLRGTL